jgi:hypothetical protein
VRGHSINAFIFLMYSETTVHESLREGEGLLYKCLQFLDVFRKLSTINPVVNHWNGYISYCHRDHLFIYNFVLETMASLTDIWLCLMLPQKKRNGFLSMVR